MQTTETTTTLHVLCRATDAHPDATQVQGTCGCMCVASQRTHELLAEPGKHVIYCLPCFMAEHD